MRFTSYIDSKFSPAVANLFVLYSANQESKALLKHFTRHIDDAMNVILYDISCTAKFELLPVGYEQFDNYVLNLTSTECIDAWKQNDPCFKFHEIAVPPYRDALLPWVMHISLAINQTLLKSPHIEIIAQRFHNE